MRPGSEQCDHFPLPVDFFQEFVGTAISRSRYAVDCHVCPEIGSPPLNSTRKVPRPLAEEVTLFRGEVAFLLFLPLSGRPVPTCRNELFPEQMGRDRGWPASRRSQSVGGCSANLRSALSGVLSVGSPGGAPRSLSSEVGELQLLAIVSGGGHQPAWSIFDRALHRKGARV